MKKMMMPKGFILTMVALLMSSMLWAQGDKANRPSPPATATGKINGATI
ncbi:MAG: hypothetical protein JWQ09_5366, partial [Segetibacter sp.]|nr:hypothetical protein [Segetibacter sp.]